MDSKKQKRLNNVVVSANSAHYIHAVSALYKAGYLKKFYSSFIITKEPVYLRWLFMNKLLQRLKARFYREVPGVLIKNIWFPELLYNALKKINYRSLTERYKIQNECYDHAVAKRIKPAAVFHFINGIGLETARKAKAEGAFIICDQRAVHPKSEIELAARQKKETGFFWEHAERAFLDKVYQEHDIADLILVNSSFAKQTFLDAGFCSDKIKVLNLGVNLERFFPMPMEKSACFQVLFVGNIYPQKGVHYLLNAWKTLNLSDAELVLIGHEIVPVIEPVIGQNMKKFNITHHQPLPNYVLNTYYNKADVFILPSITESWGLVGLEAMAAGCPVIVTECCGVKDAVRDGLDGLVIQVESEKAIQNAILKLYNNRELARQMGASAHKRAADFSWERYGRSLLDIYEALPVLSKD